MTIDKLDNLDDFEIYNRYGANSPDNPNPFGATGRRQLLRVPEDARERFGEDLAWAAVKQLPPVRKGPHLDYRMLVVQEFIRLADEPQKKKEGEPFRPGALGQLDRAFTRVAEACDRSESRIRNACRRAYEGDALTKAFREDCIAISEIVSNGD